MMRHIGVLGLVFIVTLASSVPAHAHERRQVGPYTFVAGFLTEPAYTGVPNGIDLRVTETATNQPVEGLQETLEVEVTAAGHSRRLKLRSRFGQPGAYAADFVPTRRSTYVFRFVGKVRDLAVDERFESGPGRFDEPQDIGQARFPPDDPLRDLREGVEQTRLLAAAALVLSIAIPLGAALWLRRR